MPILHRQVNLLIEKDKASIGMLQRMFKIGFTVPRVSGISLQMQAWSVRRRHEAAVGSDEHGAV